jgi:hypothetical protein
VWLCNKQLVMEQNVRFTMVGRINLVGRVRIFIFDSRSSMTSSRQQGRKERKHRRKHTTGQNGPSQVRKLRIFYNHRSVTSCLFEIELMGLLYSVSKTGPSTEPRGTPNWRWTSTEELSSIQTNCRRPHK